MSTTQTSSESVQPFARLFDRDRPNIRDRFSYDQEGDVSAPVTGDYLTGDLGLTVTLSNDLAVLFPHSSVHSAIALSPHNSPKVSSFIQNAIANRSVNFTFDSAQTGFPNSGNFVAPLPEVQRQSQASTYDLNALKVQWAVTQEYQAFNSPIPPVSIGNLESVLKQFAASTSHSPFSKLYIFGDSLSDPGNIFNATTFVQPFDWLFGYDIPVIPPPPYYEGHYSNGPNWADYLAQDLGLTITPSTDLSVFHPLLPFPSPVTITGDGLKASPYFQGATTNQSINFAFGGAQTGYIGSDKNFGTLIPGLLTQVGWFKNDHKQTHQSADPNALYVVWAGANDYWSVDNPNPEESVNNIETAVESLYNLGARNILVPNLPDLGKTPFAFSGGTQEIDRLTNLTDEHNFLLDTTLDDLGDSLTGINLIPLDVYSIFNDAITHPEKYGYTNVTESCLDPVTLIPRGNPDNYLFWDKVHPTSITDERLAEFALAALFPEVNSVAGLTF